MLWFINFNRSKDYFSISTFSLSLNTNHKLFSNYTFNLNQTFYKSPPGKIYIYIFTNQFCYRHTIDYRRPNPRSITPILEWLKLRQLLPYLPSPSSSSSPGYFPINCLCRLLAGRFQPTRSITANRLIFTRSIFPRIFHKTRYPSVQTSITAVSPWSRSKRSSLERTGGALVRREIPLYTRSRGARITFSSTFKATLREALRGWILPRESKLTMRCSRPDVCHDDRHQSLFELFRWN